MIGGIYELDPQGKKMRMYHGSSELVVNTETGLNLTDLLVIIIDDDGEGNFTMELQLKPDAVIKISDLTNRNLGKTLVFALNDVIFIDAIITIPIESNRLEIGFGLGPAYQLIEILSGKVEVPQFGPINDSIGSELLLNPNH